MATNTSDQREDGDEQQTNNKQTTIDSDVEIGRQPVTGVIDADSIEEIEVLGHVVWSTTGDVIVPREWLIDEFEEIPGGRDLIPPAPWPSSAYKLTMSHLLKPQFRFVDETFLDGYRIDWRLEHGDSGHYRHLLADVTIPESEAGEAGGTIASVKTVTFNYEKEAQAMSFITHLADREDEEIEELPDVVQRLYDPLVTLAQRHVDGAQQLFSIMKESHDGQDLRRIFYYLRDEESHSVPLRHGGAVYFFPARYSETIEGLARVWQKMNDFKAAGHEAEIATIPLIDSEGHREMVQRHATRALETRVTTIIDDGLARLAEAEAEADAEAEAADEDEDEESPQEIVADLVAELQESLEMAAEYSALLDADLSVERHLRARRSELDGEEAALIEGVLAAEQIGEDEEGSDA